MLHYGIIARVLTQLLRKNTPFVWTNDCTIAFEALKQALVSAPVLALTDFKKTFVVETYASEYGIGAVLQQDGHPLAYLSQALGPRNRGPCTYEKELMAVLLAVNQWRQYLQAKEFVIKTNQKSLVHLEDQRLHTVWQQKAFTKLWGLRYQLCYRKGTDNGAADALSRQPTDATTVACAISSCQPTWLNDVRQGYSQDPHELKIITEIQAQPEAHSNYAYMDGLLRYKGCILVGRNEQVKQ